MMYKKENITAALILEDFPDVAAEIVANANSGDEQESITLDSIRNSHPEIVSALQKEGADTSVAEATSGERERIKSIQALSQVGYESVISAAIEDGKSTAEEVKVKLFDAMNDNREKAHTEHQKDGKSLGKTMSELSGGSQEGGDDSSSEDDKAVASMEEAGKKARGEA